jgi:membrane protein implicated in regulation of membrane protease activity
MSNTSFREFANAMEDVARDIVRACRRGIKAIVAMPWPAMLACCIGLALLISILPLALFLFVLFMAVKLVVGAFVVDRRRDLRERHTDTTYSKQ